MNPQPLQNLPYPVPKELDSGGWAYFEGHNFNLRQVGPVFRSARKFCDYSGMAVVFQDSENPEDQPQQYIIDSNINIIAGPFNKVSGHGSVLECKNDQGVFVVSLKSIAGPFLEVIGLNETNGLVKVITKDDGPNVNLIDANGKFVFANNWLDVVSRTYLGGHWVLSDKGWNVAKPNGDFVLESFLPWIDTSSTRNDFLPVNTGNGYNVMLEDGSMLLANDLPEKIGTFQLVSNKSRKYAITTKGDSLMLVSSSGKIIDPVASIEAEAFENFGRGLKKFHLFVFNTEDGFVITDIEQNKTNCTEIQLVNDFVKRQTLDSRSTMYDKEQKKALTKLKKLLKPYME